ncbi:MAG TPA: PRC-barrel domain-containing protein [Aliidongia sp.]|nr:PRC-barrel domain-containing protein [Aliidongia sp.]
MLWDASSLQGYAIEATDGDIGTVSDLLFEDIGWVVRWLVVDTGHWLTGRKVLLPLSVLGQPDRALRSFPVKLTRQQVKDGPDVDTAQPVSRQDEAKISHYYRWTPYPVGSDVPLSNTMAIPFVEPLFLSPMGPAVESEPDVPGDPHLRSIAAVTGYHIHATDGEIGHVESFLVDDADWSIRYLVVDTRNWWPGEKILVSPRSVTEIDWADESIHVDVHCQKIKDGPRYDPAVMPDGAYDEKFLVHYGIKRIKP